MRQCTSTVLEVQRTFYVYKWDTRLHAYGAYFWYVPLVLRQRRPPNTAAQAVHIFYFFELNGSKNFECIIVSRLL